MNKKRTIWMMLVVSLVCLGAQAAPQSTATQYLPSGTLGEGLQASSPAEHFIGKKLFDYMDGGAELYLAYGFSDLGVRKYTRAGIELTLAIYQMGSDKEAFGIYAFAAKGKRAALTGPNSLTPHMLSFHKGRYYVRVLTQKPSLQASAAMVLLAKKVFSLLPGPAQAPDEVKYLPKGEIPGSLRYLTNPGTAQTIWFGGEGKVFLSPGATAVTATYAGPNEDIQLTRAAYANDKAAHTACAALIGKLGLKLSKKGTVIYASGLSEDELWHEVECKTNLVRWVEGADKQTGKTWLARIK